MKQSHLHSQSDLEHILRRIDGKGYGAYKDLKGSYALEACSLCIEHVQGDPFAAPSRISVRVPAGIAALSRDWFATPVRRRALEDFLIRGATAFLESTRPPRRGSGKSGLIGIVRPGQAILERSACRVADGEIEMIFSVGLPARGRRTLSWKEARPMLLEDLPALVDACLRARALPEKALWKHLETAEDADALRRLLTQRGWTAFVADGAILPRCSGVSDRPMHPRDAVPFEAPDELAATVSLPHAGEVRGMPIREGVTLLVGGGYHGKSTLLNALAQGVYDHIPGDGREQVVCRADAACIRAEDGRPVRSVDISPFIRDIPSGADTRHFSTEDASGSTSQAANIMEALEAGARLLLIDEDTSATNFMLRDERMQLLVARDKEPITPLLDRIGRLSREHGVSCILVVGGSGDFFDVADHVIMMDAYEPHDVTERAREVARTHPSQRRDESRDDMGPLPQRLFDPDSLDPTVRPGKVRIRSRGQDEIEFGTDKIDLRRVGPFAEEAQVTGVAELLRLLAADSPGRRPTLAAMLETLEQRLETHGLMRTLVQRTGGVARPRPLEVAAALNRLPGLHAESPDRFGLEETSPVL